ncbi:hypothetical protein MACH17_28540 [Phaeobacter inhibens]|uniref:hypothetical protein n=1 Tax=Phaeobacter inhibens TaxID=221822 RepID=UPI002777CC18|nr:hypothetical protein [Phaeobacter inhibens]GLO71337.1 hypothetical protein MACH17_28540 [Phaeobacter inhibens]
MTTQHLSPEELFRLNVAFVSIRDPAIRAEFLSTIEAWAQDQWLAGDTAQDM